MEAHSEKPCGDGYHANGQSDSEVWSEPLMEPAEPRRPRLSFTDTYVDAHISVYCNGFLFMLELPMTSVQQHEF